MFNQIRNRLLFYYLFVLASILAVFSISVKVFFTRSLIEQVRDRLILTGQNAASNVEFEEDKFKFEDDFIKQNLNLKQQSIEWFNPKSQLFLHQGEVLINAPLVLDQTVQIQSDDKRIMAVTLPIVDKEDQKLVGYVRVSQSLDELDETIEELNWGLGSGITVALLLSGIGGIWLTRQAMQPIEQSFQRLQQFTADASHELRSPLMAIKSNAAVALKYPQGMRESDREKFSTIASATSQMTHLTDDLLFLARSDNLPTPEDKKS